MKKKTTKKRKRRKSNGGSTFERQIAKELSLWWTDGKRDDVFWRSAASGARATARRKSGKRTRGHHGDLCATDPIGDPFIQAFTNELKKGYTGHTVANLLDVPKKGKEQKYEGFFKQVIAAHEAAGSFSWLLIVHRSRWETLAFIPDYAWAALGDSEKNLRAVPFLHIRFLLNRKRPSSQVRVVGMRLKNFLEIFTPEVVNRLARM